MGSKLKESERVTPLRLCVCVRVSSSSLSDTVLLFQPTGSTRRQNGNLYCNNCSKFACRLVKGQRRSTQQQRFRTD